MQETRPPTRLDDVVSGADKDVRHMIGPPRAGVTGREEPPHYGCQNILEDVVKSEKEKDKGKNEENPQGSFAPTKTASFPKLF